MNVAAEPQSRISIRKMTQKLRALVGCENCLKFPILEL